MKATVTTMNEPNAAISEQAGLADPLCFGEVGVLEVVLAFWG